MSLRTSRRGSLERLDSCAQPSIRGMLFVFELGTASFQALMAFGEPAPAADAEITLYLNSTGSTIKNNTRSCCQFCVAASLLIPELCSESGRCLKSRRIHGPRCRTSLRRISFGPILMEGISASPKSGWKQMPLPLRIAWRRVLSVEKDLAQRFSSVNGIRLLLRYIKPDIQTIAIGQAFDRREARLNCASCRAIEAYGTAAVLLGLGKKGKRGSTS